MRNDSGGLWGYLWAALTAFFTALSVQDISIIFGALITAALGVMTYLSNDKRNKRIAAAAEDEAAAAKERNVILAKHYRRRYNDPPEDGIRDSNSLDELQEAD